MARILFIDDLEPLRDVFEEILEQAGYEVTSADDGTTGVEAYKKTGADVVITDILMREKDGFDTIREILLEDPEAKIIAMTAYEAHNLELAYDLGASKVFEKPVKPREILDAVKELLAG